MTGRSADPAAVAAAYLASFASGDPDSVATHVDEHFLNEHASVLGQPSVGRAQYRQRLPGFLATFAGLSYDVERLIVDGETVAAPYRMRATVDGRPIDLRGVMVLTVTDGLVAARVDYWDGVTFQRQLAGEI